MYATPVAVLLSVLLAATGIWYGWHLVRDRSRSARTADLAHLAMCGAMIAMAWSWGGGLLAAIEVVFFGAAALWFGRAAARHVGVGDAELPLDACHGDVRGRGAVVLTGYHGLMMASMVWMAIEPMPMSHGMRGMSGMGGTGAATSGTTGTSGMVGMTGGGMPAAATVSPAVHVANVTLGIGYTLAAAWFAVRVVRLLRQSRTRRVPIGDALGHEVANVVMGGAMAVGFLAMV